MIRVQYKHPSLPPYGIKVQASYEVTKEGNSFVVHGDYRQDVKMTKAEIELFFDIVEGSLGK